MCVLVCDFNDFKALPFFFQTSIPEFGESQRLGDISDHTQLAAFLKKPKEQLIDLVAIRKLVVMARMRPVRSPIQRVVARSRVWCSIQD